MSPGMKNSISRFWSEDLRGNSIDRKQEVKGASELGKGERELETKQKTDRKR